MGGIIRFLVITYVTYNELITVLWEFIWRQKNQKILRNMNVTLHILYVFFI